MAIVLKPPSASGICCECGNIQGCGCDENCELECRSLSTVAELCGFPEYADPSVPPKKYRRKTLAGETRLCTYASSNCDDEAEDSPGNTRAVYSGINSYDPVTCELTIEAQIAEWRNSSGCGVEADFFLGADLREDLGFNSAFLEEIDTATIRRQVHRTDAGCFLITLAPLARGLVDFSGSTDRTATLDDEDTEDDALARATTDAEEWQVTQDPLTCLDTTSFWTERTSGYSFAVRKVQVRVRIMDPVPNAFYEVTVRFYERPLAVGGPWEFFGRQDVLMVQADANPATEEWTPWIDVPIERGTEIRAQSCSVELQA